MRKDEEVKAVQVLYRAIQEHPQSYPLLQVQSDFLRIKVGAVACHIQDCGIDDVVRTLVRARQNGRTSLPNKR